MSEREPLLLYLASASDPARTAVGPALAAAAERSGWRFECYYDALRRGRHFGGGDPEEAQPGWPNGSLAAGGRHADQLLWLSTRYRIAALGDPGSALWPALDELGAEALARSSAPGELYAAALARLEADVPRRVLVVDASPQGPHGVRAAPYLYPCFLDSEPVLGLEAGADPDARKQLEHLGAERFEGLFVEAARAESFPGGLDAREGEVGSRGYAEWTAELAERHAGWSRGVLLGDPDLVASQLGRAATLRLAPLYGRPQTRAIELAETVVAAAREPVYGRQFDDRDFFELARRGRGLQVVDPGPPFESARGLGPSVPTPAAASPDPDDAQLERWAREGRVLSTLLLWCGMVRELDCLPHLIDLVAETGLSAGLVTTAEVLELAAGSSLFLLGVPPQRGGVYGLLEPLLGSTGRGVAAEALMPRGALAESLAASRAAAAARLPASLEPEGWWPLLDAPLEAVRPSRLTWRSGRPALLYDPRGGEENAEASAGGRKGPREIAGALVRKAGLERAFEARRPFDDSRPDRLEPQVAEAVRAAGFSYMWTKAGFGDPALAFREGAFAALTLTAGNWDGWSPFYTVGDVRDLKRAERRLLRGRRPGWLVGTIDSPLWALSGELLERGSGLYRLAALTAQGGASGRLVNVTPRVIARYARLLDDLGVLPRDVVDTADR